MKRAIKKNRGRFGGAIIVCFFWMAIASLFLFFLAPRAELYIESDAFVWKTRLEQGPGATPLAAEKRVLALGDSQMMSALKLAEPGLAFSNMGLPSAQPELWAALPVEQPFDLTLINWSPYMVLKSPVYSTYLRLKQQMLFSKRPAFILEENTAASLLRASLRLLPVGAYRPLIRHCFLEAASCSNYLQNKEKNLFIHNQLQRNAGHWVWQAYAGGAPCTARPVPDASLALTANERKEAVQAWGKIFRAYRMRGRFVVVMIPFSPGWRQAGGEALLAASRKLLGDLLKDPEFSHVEFWPYQEELLAEDFQDLTHLNACGSAKFSRWFKGQLREKLDWQL